MNCLTTLLEGSFTFTWLCSLLPVCSCCFGFAAMTGSSQRKYKYDLRDALQVTEGIQGWTVIVQVVIKYPTKPSQNNPNVLYKKFLLTDMKGTQISAITFKAIEQFDKIFQPFKRYYVTNAGVKVAVPKYKVGEYNYTWTLYPQTHVQLIDDPKPYVCPFSFDFTKFSEMFRVADREVSVAVKGLIVHSIPVANATKPFVRDYVLIDEEKRPTVLRLWSDVLNEDETEITKKLPIPTFIAAVDLKVTTHNGLSLTTGFNAHFMIEPPLRETEPLHTWYSAHADDVKQLIEHGSYKSTDLLLPPPSTADILPMKEVLETMETRKTAWVAGTIHLLPTQAKLWHAICDKCKKTVSLPVGTDLPCMFCSKDMDVQPRCHVHVYLNDSSETLPATLFAATAENFIGYTAWELMEAAEKKAPLNDEIARKIDKKQVVCFLKDYDRSYDTKFERNFPVVKLYTQEEVNSTKANDVSSLSAATLEINTTETTIPPAMKEKQLFSPGTKKVVDEIANTAGVETVGLVKRGITFSESSSAPVPAAVPEDATPGPAAGSPIKKSKNLLRSK